MQGMAPSGGSCQRHSASLPCRSSRCRASASRCCCRCASLHRGRRSRPAAPRPVARKCLACASGGQAYQEDQHRAGELSRKSAQALARSLVRAGGHHPDGFEDDPITYVQVGWSGGCLPSATEAEISGRLCKIFHEDVARLLDKAVKSWLRKKQAEEYLRAEHSPVEFVKAHLHLGEHAKAVRPARSDGPLPEAPERQGGARAQSRGARAAAGPRRASSATPNSNARRNHQRC
mmetsp:Transcript_44149/g.89124  ORF Transcript_44149/g.89124 Transcript_44149/m.89124 type:complete len:233 (-) Transcript_44149:239-937(-)